MICSEEGFKRLIFAFDVLWLNGEDLPSGSRFGIKANLVRLELLAFSSFTAR
jgi:hypothetical protein